MCLDPLPLTRNSLWGGPQEFVYKAIKKWLRFLAFTVNFCVTFPRRKSGSAPLTYGVMPVKGAAILSVFTMVLDPKTSWMTYTVIATIARRPVRQGCYDQVFASKFWIHLYFAPDIEFSSEERWQAGSACNDEKATHHY